MSTMRVFIILFLSVITVISFAVCAIPLPRPSNNFVASLSQAQAWDLAPSMFTMYSIQGVGYRYDMPILVQNYFYDIKNRIVVVMNQTDYTCVVTPWPQAADMWSFISPGNSIMVTPSQMLNGQNFTFWQFTNGAVSPNEAWAFAGDTPLSGTGFGIESWTFKTYEEKKIPLKWLQLPCQKTSYSTSNEVPKPLLRSVRF